MKRGTVVVGYLDGGQWSACFGLSYRDLCLRDALGRQRIVRENGRELRQLCGTGGISEGRNEVARQFLDATDGEWLWFIDTDMGFAPDTVDRLVDTADYVHRPVVGGLCFAQRRTPRGDLHAEKFGIVPTVYRFVELDDELGFVPMADYPRDQAVKVGATGAACLLIHRSVLVKIREKHGDAWFDPIVHPTGLKGGRRVFSEDLSFCIRVQGIDIPLFVDTSVKTCHEKGGIYLDEDAFDRQQAFEVLSKSPAAADLVPDVPVEIPEPPAPAPDLNLIGHMEGDRERRKFLSHF